MSTDVVLPLDEAEIRYPETDGEPMGQGDFHLVWIVMVLAHLRAMFGDRNDVAVHSDMFWYPIEGDPSIRKAPDVMVAFGRSQLADDGSGRLSYRQWIERGIAPQVAFEAVSESNTAEDLRETFEFYDRHGVEEYYLVEPRRDQSTAFVAGFTRDAAGEFTKIRRIHGWVSPRLGIRFEVERGNLVLRRPDGRVFDHPHAAVQERDKLLLIQDEILRDREAIHAENARMQVEIDHISRERDEFRARAIESEARARREQERAEKLTTMLRKLGVDPGDFSDPST